MQVTIARRSFSRVSQGGVSSTFLLQQAGESLHGGVSASRADAAHGADEIVVVEQSVDLLGTELAAAVRVQNRPCRAPERDGVADRGRGQSSSDKTRLIPLA